MGHKITLHVERVGNTAKMQIVDQYDNVWAVCKAGTLAELLCGVFNGSAKCNQAPGNRPPMGRKAQGELKLEDLAQMRQQAERMAREEASERQECAQAAKWRAHDKKVACFLQQLGVPSCILGV